MRWYSDLSLFQEDWFSELPSKHKVLWHYLNVSCNVAGIWSPNFKTASALTGEKFSDSDLKAFGARIRRLKSGKILLVGYATEQWGDLSSNQGIHKKILGLLKAEGLEINDLSVVSPHLYSATPEYTREGEGVREGVQKEKGYGEKETIDAKTCLEYLNQKTGRSYRAVESNLDRIVQRLSEPDVSVDGVKKMIDRQAQKWMGTDFEEYLRPQTLFAKEKFDGYYGAKDAPVINGHKKGEFSIAQRASDL